MGDVPYGSARVGCVFAVYSGVGIGDDGEGNNIVYVVDNGEVDKTWLDERITGIHGSAEDKKVDVWIGGLCL